MLVQFRLRPVIFSIYTTRSYSSKSAVAMANKKNNFDSIFSPENKQRTLEELSNLESESFIENFIGNSVKKKAAVLVPLCYDLENRPALLFNLRSKSMSSHQGELCYPGGAVDPEDNDDVIVAALRETEEELGIHPSEIEVWTTLPYVPTVTSVMRVAPVLGFIKKSFDPRKLNVNPAEVEFAFTVPIEHLCDPKNWESTSLTKKGRFLKFTSMPAFTNLEEFMGGEKVRLWGLTAIITHMVLTFLVPQGYQREIPMSSRVIQKPKL